MRHFCLTLLLLSGFLATTALAQDSSSTEPEDVVIATGRVQGTDPAMSAFINGDYETAEIEFKKNYSQLIRQENFRDQSLRQTQNNATTQQIINGPPTPGSQGGQLANSSTPNGFDVRGLNQRAKREKDSASRIGSGDNLGYQLYMTGMSQLQLKKYVEAKTSFKRAIRRTKSLHDARLRLGLLEMRDGNIEAAQAQYTKLLKAKKTCKSRCDRVEAIELGVTILGEALAKIN